MPAPTRRFMYTPHPDKIRFPSIIPPHLADAPDHVHVIDYAHLVEMHDTITELASLVADLDPRCVLFFATGGYPIALPLLPRLYDVGHTRLTSGSVFHMFPGLSWGGNYDGMSAIEYTARELQPLLRAEGDGKRPIVAIDTTNVGNAVNVAVKAIIAACERAEITDQDINVIGIVNGDGAETSEDHSRLFLPSDDDTSRGTYLRSSRWIPTGRSNPKPAAPSFLIRRRLASNPHRVLVGRQALHGRRRGTYRRSRH